jgi:hypothetical protein
MGSEPNAVLVLFLIVLNKILMNHDAEIQLAKGYGLDPSGCLDPRTEE